MEEQLIYPRSQFTVSTQTTGEPTLTRKLSSFSSSHPSTNKDCCKLSFVTRTLVEQYTNIDCFECYRLGKIERSGDHLGSRSLNHCTSKSSQCNPEYLSKLKKKKKKSWLCNTVSTESSLTEAGNSCSRQAYFTSQRGILTSARAYFTLLAYKASAEIRRLHRKRRMVIVSAEFGGKQSHEIGPNMIGKPDDQGSG